MPIPRVSTPSDLQDYASEVPANCIVKETYEFRLFRTFINPIRTA